MMRSVIVAGLAMVLASCAAPIDKEQGADMGSLTKVSEGAWQRLAATRIFFGHQSVGGNVMEGVAEVLKENPGIGIEVGAPEDRPSARGGLFAHARIGRNQDPKSKTDEFVRRVAGEGGAPFDVVFHKYCYADILPGTDVVALFDYYRTTLDRLRREHPKTVFVHMTTPLMRVEGGPKAVVKKLLGRAPDHYDGNLLREEYNDLLRREYGGKEPLFDLAALESTRPDGRTETASLGRKNFRVLVPAFTDDGGHLNAGSRRRVAEQLLVFLAGLPEPR